jgi:hypothetical protein
MWIITLSKTAVVLLPSLWHLLGRSPHLARSTRARSTDA